MKSERNDSSEPELIIDPVIEDGKIVGQSFSWLYEDRDEALVFIEWKDGEITAYIDPIGDDEDDL